MKPIFVSVYWNLITSSLCHNFSEAKRPQKVCLHAMSGAISNRRRRQKVRRRDF